jgi:hypothetical protein
MYNGHVRVLGRAAGKIKMISGHGLRRNSWKIPGMPFDPKHGHLLWEV